MLFHQWSPWGLGLISFFTSCLALGAGSNFRIDRILPSSAPSFGGATILVYGEGFTPSSRLFIGGKDAQAAALNPSLLIGVLPPGNPGTVSVEVRNPSGRRIFLPQGFTYIPYPLQGPFFAEVSQQVGAIFLHHRDLNRFSVAGGVACADYDKDGWLDLFLPNQGGPSVLLHNNRDGTFTDLAEQAGVKIPEGGCNGAAFGDYDNDGWPDLFVSRNGFQYLFHNNRDGTFTEIAQQAGVAGSPEDRGMGVSWCDFDRDGWLDLFVTNWLDDSSGRQPYFSRHFDAVVRPARLYHNNGNGTFSPVLPPDPSVLRGAGFQGAFFDYNNDGWPDLYIVNDMGEEIHPNVLLQNKGTRGQKGPTLPSQEPSTFFWNWEDVSRTSGTGLALFGMGVTIGDYNGDGRLDIYATNMGPSILLQNLDNRLFEEKGMIAGVSRPVINYRWASSWGCEFADFNNDGWLDLYLVSGFLDSDPISNRPLQPNSLFLNNKDGTFLDVSAISGANDPGMGRGCAVGDFNNDGWLDLFVVNVGSRGLLFQNRGPQAGFQGHWLGLRLHGTRSNRMGIGARLILTAGGRQQIREVIAGSSCLSQSSPWVHFGLGETSQIDRLEIYWPSGAVQVIHHPPIDQWVDIEEPQEVTPGELYRLIRVLLGFSPLAPSEKKAWDMNRDGQVSLSDLLSLLRQQKGME